MVLFPEALRRLQNEEVLVDDTSTYNYGTGMYNHDDTITQESITLDEESLVYVDVKFQAANCHGCGFIEVDGVDVAASGNITPIDGEITVNWLGVLAAGSRAIHFPVSKY